MIADEADVSRGAFWHHLAELEKLLEHYERAFATPEHFAALIWLGDLTHLAHNERTRECAVELREVLDREWIALFAKVRIAPEQLRAVRCIVMDCLRGKALHHMIGVLIQSPFDRRALLKIVVSQLSSADGTLNSRVGREAAS